MMGNRNVFGVVTLGAWLALVASPPARSQDTGQTTLQQQVDQLKHEVDTLTTQSQGQFATDSSVHLAGYGTAAYISQQDSNSSFRVLSFSPIFHYQYRDLLMLEAEVEMGYTADGETETNLEYAALDLFINDNLSIVAGQFLSPIGQFRQNFHPSWINKMASKPVGFDDGGAAPLTETGVQLRGGANLSDSAMINYALYVGNGPRLVDNGGELEVETENVSDDANQNKVVGGRVGFLPMRNFEVGISAANGKANLEGESDRSYRVYDVDVGYQPGIVDVRAEYVRTEVGELVSSAIPEKHTWTAWYVQGSHQFAATHLEPAIRYGRYEMPDGSVQKQTAVGVNYVFAPNVIAKANYAFNQGEAGTAADRNAVMVQLAYGF